MGEGKVTWTDSLPAAPLRVLSWLPRVSSRRWWESQHHLESTVGRTQSRILLTVFARNAPIALASRIAVPRNHPQIKGKN